MSRPQALSLRNQRFDADPAPPSDPRGNPDSGPPLGRLRSQTEATFEDVTGLRKLDEASVDACFSQLSDLLAELDA